MQINTADAQQNTDYLKGRAFEIKNLPDSALHYYNQAIVKKPTDPKLLICRGNTYILKKNYNLALTDYLHANQTYANIASFETAKTYALKFDTLNTIKYLKKHLESNFKLAPSNIRMNPVFLKFENTKLWNDLWAVEWYDKSDYLEGEARFMLNNKDYLGVINFITGILKEGSKKDELHYMLACAYFGMNNLDMAIESFTTAINLTHRKYKYYLDRSEAFRLKKQYSNAIEDLTAAISIAPDEFDLYIKRSENEYLHGQYENALGDVKFYLLFFENDNKAILLAGKIENAKSNYLNAIVYTNQLIRQNKNNVQALLIRAESYYKTGMYTNAIADYDKCIKMEPKNILALRNRGMVFFSQDNTKSACADWKKAMQYGDFESNNLYLDNCR
jgi:tetratricopeptide (TPR) repeat protein